MDAETPAKCGQCGCKLRLGEPDALCPACLLTLAMDLGDDDLAESLETEQPSGAFGDYNLIRELGRGGMGRVYLAEHRESGRRVALKMLAHKLDSHEIRQRFFREGRLAASFSHPNSLHIFGSEEIEGHPVITMELAPSGTLQDRLNSRGKYPVEEAVDAVLDVINGLEAACRAGILHRDIKPSNCFYGSDGLVKVGDFGLSLSRKSPDDAFSEEREQVGGTPAYASPEQLKGDKVDLRSDIYSVGATLYHLLKGEPPHTGQDAYQIVSKSLSEDPGELGADVPFELQQVVMRCLHKNPNRRYGDYQSLRNSLLRFSSMAMERATLIQRLSAGWIDFLLALFPAYAVLMLTVGGEGLVVRPIVNPTIGNARYYFLLMAVGILYFAIFEGLRGAGLGKYLKGLVVAEPGSQRSPGFLKAMTRAAVALGSVEMTRLPLLFMFVRGGNWTAVDTVGFVFITVISGSLPPLFAMRSGDGLTWWDRLSKTHVFQRLEGVQRGQLTVSATEAFDASSLGAQIGPYHLTGELVPGKWLAGRDTVLRRDVWLIHPETANSFENVEGAARSTRLRWLQRVEENGSSWEAFNAPKGLPLTSVLELQGARTWSCLRYALHDLMQEFSAAEADGTLPDKLTLDHVWITEDWRALLLESAYPSGNGDCIEHNVKTIGGKQSLLEEILEKIERTTMPVHARKLKQRICDREFGNMRMLMDFLGSLLMKPAVVDRALSFTSSTILPGYIWLATGVGHYHDKPFDYFRDTLPAMTLVCLACYALLQLVILVGFKTSAGNTLFGLSFVPLDDQPIKRPDLIRRYAIIWGSLFIPAGFAYVILAGASAYYATVGWLVLWLTGTFLNLFRIPCNWLEDLAKVYVVRD